MPKLLKEARKEVSFELATQPKSKVFVAGTFNDWNPTAHPLKDNPDSGYFKTTIALAQGTHEYKFIVNGQWIVDPKNLRSVPNSVGSVNIVLQV